MSYDVFKISGKLFLSSLSIVCVLFVIPAAFAAVVDGCDEKVMNALNAKAQAKVAYDVAVTEEMIDKPDSVLAMTCFNQAAGTSAVKGGGIFSGDFTDGLSPIIETALEDIYKNFAGTSTSNSAPGFDSQAVDYTATLVDTFNCQGMNRLWDQTNAEGINTKTPYATIDDLINGTIPSGGGKDFDTSWKAAATQGVFSDLSAAVAALPAPGSAEWPVHDFSNCKSSADVLALVNSGTACP